MGSTIGRIYDTQHQINDAELEWRFSDLEETKAEMRKAHEALVGFVRESNRKIADPTPLQQSVQTASEFSAGLSFVTTSVAVAATIAMGGATVAAGAAVAHTAFDAMGGYDWAGKQISELTGWSEQTGKTLAYGVRTAAFLGSALFSLKSVAGAITSTDLWKNLTLQNGWQGAWEAYSTYGVDKEVIVEGGRQVVEYPLRKLGIKASLALGSGFGLSTQMARLKSSREVPDGQLKTAQHDSLADEVDTLKKKVSSGHKAVRRTHAETRRIEDILKRTVETQPEPLAGG